MDSLHRQYLDEMGIAVFSLRPAKRESENTDEPVGHQAQQENIIESQSKSVESAREKLKRQVNLSGHANESLSTSALSTHALPTNALPTKSIPSKIKANPDTPTFFFCFLDYEDISLMVSLDIKADSLSSEIRQLCDDIVFALSSRKQVRLRKIPKIRELRWPMVSASHIQQTSEDASLILGDMIKQSRENLILFGADTAEYRTKKTEGTYLLVDSIEHYLETPLAKAELWQKLRPMLQ